MAGRAEDVVALAAPRKERGCDRHGKIDEGLAVSFARVEPVVQPQLPARHGVLDDRPDAALVRVKRRSSVSPKFRLVMHVLPAGDNSGGHQERGNRRGSASHGSTSITTVGPKRVRNDQVSSWS